MKVTESTPVTVNDAALARRLNGAIANALGKDVVVPFRQTNMGAEDFAYFVEPSLGVKGVYFDVGGTPADQLGSAPSHHSPFFKIQPEPSIKSGIEAMVVSAMALMPPAE